MAKSGSILKPLFPLQPSQIQGAHSSPLHFPQIRKKKYISFFSIWFLVTFPSYYLYKERDFWHCGSCHSAISFSTIPWLYSLLSLHSYSLNTSITDNLSHFTLASTINNPFKSYFLSLVFSSHYILLHHFTNPHLQSHSGPRIPCLLKFQIQTAFSLTAIAFRSSSLMKSPSVLQDSNSILPLPSSYQLPPVFTYFSISFSDSFFFSETYGFFQ